MELAAATQLFSCRLALLLSVLSVCLCAGLDDPYSMFDNFTIKAHSTLWLEGWSSVNGECFMQYHDNKATPSGVLGKVVNGTETWTDFTHRWEYIGEELKKQILNTEEEADKTVDHTWQVTMDSQYKHGNLAAAFWKFILDGQEFFYFNPVTNTWGVIHDKATGIMKKWETNSGLASDLARFSKEDSGHYYKEFSKHWKEIPRSTSKAPATTQLPSAGSLSPPTQSPHVAVFIFIGFILLAFVLACLRKFRRCSRCSG